MKNLFAIILFLLLITPMYSQLVTGTVTDGRDPLPGASVIVKGTQVGTTTDLDGNFQINLDGKKILVVSYLGYETQEVQVTGNSVSIVLIEQANFLDEIVVTGYSSAKKRSITGSIAKVSSEELKLVTSNNLTKSLQGSAAGIVVRQSSPQPGYDDNPIYIRGTGTFNNSEALVVIDGVPNREGGLSRLSPDEIESISIIKDATSAIYGSRAANGVIVVTTKKGQSGEPSITYSNLFSFDRPIFLPPALNALDFVTWQNEAFGYEGGTTYAPYTDEGIAAYRSGNTDGYIYPNGKTAADILFNESYWAPRSKHNLSIQGGSEYTKYFLSGGISDQASSLKDDISQFNQTNLRINLDQKINNYLNISANVLVRQEANRLWPGGDPQFISVPENTPSMMGRLLMNMYLSGPLAQAYWPNGAKTSAGAIIDQVQGRGGEVNTSSQYLQSNIEAVLKIPGIEGMQFKGTVGYDKYNSYMKKLTTPIDIFNLATGATDASGLVPNKLGSSITLTQYSTISYNNLYQGLLTYDKTFSNHTLNVLAGVSREESNRQNFWTHRTNLISASTDVLSQGQVGTEKNNGGEFGTARLNYFGNLNYNFKEKYLLQFLFRYDGSYLFPENSRYGFFPGVSGGWVLSEEAFMKDKLFNFLKIRGSYGELGNDNVPPNQFLSTFNSGVWFVNGSTVQTLNETKVANPFITWEVAKNIDFGIEGSLFNNRLSFEIDYFKSNRDNILTQPYGSIPDILGIKPPFENIGKTENKGWEFTLGFKDQIGDFNYNVTSYISTNQNTLIFADEPEGLDPAVSREGRRIGAWKYYNILGVFQNQAEVDANTVSYAALGNGTLKPGDLIVEDVNGDGVINSYDYKFTEGSIIPKMTSALGIQIGYKNFDANIRFYGTFGGYVDQPYGYANGYITQYVFDNRWTKEGDQSLFGRANNRNGGNPYTGLMIAKTDHIKLQNIEIGYNIKGTFLNKFLPDGFIDSARIYVNGNDLVYWTFDEKLWSHPEAFTGDKDNGSGVFVPITPAQSLLSTGNLSFANKSVSFGLNVKF